VRATASKASDLIEIYLLGGKPVVATGNEGVITEGVERMQVRALGGADHINVYTLAGSDVQSVEIDLAATAGGALADANADTVTRYGTSVNDIVDIRWSGNKVVVDGLSAAVSVAHAGTNDTIIVNGFTGNDILNAATMPTGKARLRLLGDLGDDVIFGGAGNDTVVGGLGNDATFMGAGNDLYSWNAGDGADRVEGQAGTDTIVLNGQAVSESFDVAVAGNQVNVNTNSGLIDLDDVERIRIQGFAGTDMITVRNYAGTDVKQLAIDLGLAGGADDSASDYVIGLGSGGNDQITLTTSSTGVVSMTGFGAQVTVSHVGVGDSIQLITFGGDDVINTATMPASSPNLAIDVGQGDDKVTGGAGRELISGGLGHDTLRGGAGEDYLYGEEDEDYLDGGSGTDSVDGGGGDDVIVGGKGDDTLWGGAGNDTFRYTSKLDGRDLIADFDGDAAGGQDTLNLDAWFDALGIANGSRAGLVELIDNGANVEVKVNADGNAGNGFELQVAILVTADTINVGQDIVVAA
jgi:Ca2+-binding RTX toxin-like protein